MLVKHESEWKIDKKARHDPDTDHEPVVFGIPREYAFSIFHPKSGRDHDRYPNMDRIDEEANKDDPIGLGIRWRWSKPKRRYEEDYEVQSMKKALVATVLLFFCRVAPSFSQDNVVYNPELQQFAAHELGQIVRVVSTKPVSYWNLVLLDHRKGGKFQGISYGDGKIGISDWIVQGAFRSGRLIETATTDRPYTISISGISVLRMMLAHEIAHDELGHKITVESIRIGAVTISDAIRMGVPGLYGDIGGLVSDIVAMGIITNVARSNELEADKEGLRYWSLLGYKCVDWVNIAQHFFGPTMFRGGDAIHPSEARIRLALDSCSTLPAHQKVATLAWIEKQRQEHERKLELEREQARQEQYCGDKPRSPKCR